MRVRLSHEQCCTGVKNARAAHVTQVLCVMMLAVVVAAGMLLTFVPYAFAANETTEDTSSTASESAEKQADASDTSSSNTNQENAVNEQLLPDSSFIYETSLADLARADQFYDGQTVQVTGEVVGDNIHQLSDPDYCWISLCDPKSDGRSVLAVCMKTSDAMVIKHYGDYREEGTQLQVRGTYHLACSEHQGISDVHAEFVTVVAEGASVSQDFSWNYILPGALMIVIGCIALFIYWRMREGQR